MARKLSKKLYWFDQWTAQQHVVQSASHKILTDKVVGNQLFARIIPENGAYTVATNDFATTNLTVPTYDEARNIIEGLFTLALGD